MDAIRILAVLVVLGPAWAFAQVLDSVFPRAFGIAINQVGYMGGSSLGEDGGPWRAGIRRDFDVRNYMPIDEIGEAVGVRFVSTKFYIIPEHKPPASRDAGFDHNVLVMDREGFGNEWYAYASLPSSDIDSFGVDLIESHWANWLATDDFQQPALNRLWIEYLRSVQAHPKRYLAKNSDQLISQWFYRKFAKAAFTGPSSLRIDNRAMPAKAYETGMVGNLVLAVPLKDGERLMSATPVSSMPAPTRCIGIGPREKPPTTTSRCTARRPCASSIPAADPPGPTAPDSPFCPNLWIPTPASST